MEHRSQQLAPSLDSAAAGGVADAAARGWLDAVTMMAATQPDGYAHATTGGTVELVTGIPVPTMNGVIGITRAPDPVEIAELATSSRLDNMAWAIQVRGDEVDDRIVRTADAHGLGQRFALPFMVKSLTAADAVPVPGARRVRGAVRGVYQRALAVGFEGPEPLFANLAAPSVVDHPAMRAYLLVRDGTPVATSFGILSGDLVGVFNIAVPPALRGRGYGRAATAAILHDAYVAGARTAYLQSSPDGLPLYRRMGFQLVETWSVFAPGSA
jgi:ribosomal protein S18 acetylase RimI-like enzyme